MPPLEVLKSVFGALSREDLETLMLVGRLFRAVVQRDFAQGPFRFANALWANFVDEIMLPRRKSPTEELDWCCVEIVDESLTAHLARLRVRYFR